MTEKGRQRLGALRLSLSIMGRLLNISSPSKIWERAGYQMAEEIALGISPEGIRSILGSSDSGVQAAIDRPQEAQE